MKKNNDHNQEVVDYCIDNEVQFAEGYCAIIEQKLASMGDQLHDLRRDVEFKMENIQFDSIGL